MQPAEHGRRSDMQRAVRLGFRADFQAEQFFVDRDEAPADVEIANTFVGQGQKPSASFD